MTEFKNDDHKQIILGCLLGNGYLCKQSKNAYFYMKHSERHLSWLQTKAMELDDYKSETPWYNNKSSYTWRAASMPAFNSLYDLCYKNNTKTVSMEWLDQLRAMAIAVWYGDSGTLIGRGKKNACLKTQSFGKEGNEIIAKYFNEVGMPCNLNRAKDVFNITFTVPGTKTLLSKIVAPYLPENRYFKLTPEHI